MNLIILNYAEKVFITGITGMVGSHLLDYLHRHTKWDIYGLEMKVL